MTVAELIKELQSWPQDDEVRYDYDNRHLYACSIEVLRGIAYTGKYIILTTEAK